MRVAINVWWGLICLQKINLLVGVAATTQGASLNSSNSFAKAVSSGAPIFDKSLFIKHVMEKWPTVTYFSRPQGFGKSFNKDMLGAFVRNDINSTTLFEGLTILKSTNLVETSMNQHPLVEINLSGTGGKDFFEAERNFNAEIRKAFVPFQYLLTSGTSTKDQEGIFSRIMAQSATKKEWEEALGMLCQMLTRYQISKKRMGKPVVLVDEPDAPFSAAIRNNYAAKMEKKLKNVFLHLLKTCEPYFYRAFLFGVAPIFHTGRLKNIDFSVHCTMFQPLVETEFGITRSEVEETLKKKGLKMTEDYKDRFNGIKIGSEILYSPKAVVDFVQTQGRSQYVYEEAGLQAELVKGILTDYGALPALNLQQMFEGQILNKEVTDKLNLMAVTDNEDDVWSFLCYTGHLTPLTVPAPNKGTIMEFSNKIMKNWLEATVQGAVKKGTIPDYIGFVKTFKTRDANETTKWFRDYLRLGGRFLHPEGENPCSARLGSYIETIAKGEAEAIEAGFNSSNDTCVGEFDFSCDESTRYYLLVKLAKTGSDVLESMFNSTNGSG